MRLKWLGPVSYSRQQHKRKEQCGASLPLASRRSCLQWLARLFWTTCRNLSARPSQALARGFDRVDIGRVKIMAAGAAVSPRRLNHRCAHCTTSLKPQRAEKIERANDPT